MPRWQDEEEVSQQSSSEEGSVEIEDDEEQKVSNRKRPSTSRSKGKASRDSSQSRSRGDGVPRRWITDRIHGTVHGTATGTAPRPPCSLCWPPPIVGACPCLLEENFVCTGVGRFGFCSGGKKQQQSGGRGAVMTSALLLNLAGLLVTVFAALALTDSNQDLVRIASFSNTDLKPTTTSQDTTTFPPVNLYLGLQALSVQNDTVVSYQDFCTTPGMEQFLPPQDCNTCHDTSLYIIIGLVVAMAAYLPTLASDCLRIYQDYDVNCQKTTSFVLSLVSLAGYGLVYYYYTYVCLASFYQGKILYDNNGNVVGPEEANGSGGVVVADFDWRIGSGQICLFVGFGLKAIDFLCNCCVATPTITRDRKEQWKYERLSEQAELGVYTSEKDENAKEDHQRNIRDDSSASEES